MATEREELLKRLEYMRGQAESPRASFQDKAEYGKLALQSTDELIQAAKENEGLRDALADAVDFVEGLLAKQKRASDGHVKRLAALKKILGRRRHAKKALS